MVAAISEDISRLQLAKTTQLKLNQRKSMILSVFLINHYWPLATILAIELIVTLTFHKIIHVGKVDPFADELLSRIF